MTAISLTQLRPGAAAMEPAGPESATSVKNQLKALSLTMLGPTGVVEGPGTSLQIRLESPSIAPTDVSLNDFLAQLETLAQAPIVPFTQAAAVDHLVGGASAMAQAMQADPPLDSEQAAALAASFEDRAAVVERSIRDLIENSTYPNFSDFLKELVQIAQKLREAATAAKMAAIQANYTTMMSAADAMLLAANEAKASRDEQIKAERTEAIAKIITGIVEGAIMIGFGAMGATQVGTTVSQISGSIISGESGLIATEFKLQSSELQLKSDLANVVKQRLEAAAKLIEQQTAVADDLREIAKGLRDLALKILQDFVAAHKEVSQHANI